MKKEFVPYKIALELKELGFDEPCFGFYGTDGYLYIQYARNGNIFKRNNGCLSPTFSQIFRWFREKYKLHIFIYFILKGTNKLGYDIFDIESFRTINISSDVYDTYEEAELECLKKLIEIVKEK